MRQYKTYNIYLQYIFIHFTLMWFTYCCTMNYLDGHDDCDRGGQCFLNNSNVHLQWPSWLWLPIAIIVCFFSFLSGTFFIIWLYYIITLFCAVFKVNCYIIMVFLKNDDNDQGGNHDIVMSVRRRDFKERKRRKP